MPRLGLAAAWGLIVIAAGVVAVGAVLDIRGRPSSAEATVRHYLAALEASDLEAALAEIAPPARGAVAGFVEQSTGNEYRVIGVATEYASIWERLAGAPAAARSVTAFLAITQKDGTRWQAAPRVGLVEAEGRTYLARPLLMD